MPKDTLSTKSVWDDSMAVQESADSFGAINQSCPCFFGVPFSCYVARRSDGIHDDWESRRIAVLSQPWLFVVRWGSRHEGSVREITRILKVNGGPFPADEHREAGEEGAIHVEVSRYDAVCGEVDDQHFQSEVADFFALNVFINGNVSIKVLQ